MRYTIGTKGSRSLGISFVSLKHFLPDVESGVLCLRTDALVVAESPTRDLETFLRSHGYPDADIGIK